MDVVVPIDGKDRRGTDSKKTSESDSLLLLKRKEALENPDMLNPFLDTPVTPDSVIYRCIKVFRFFFCFQINL
jgi:hypothetical protein